MRRLRFREEETMNSFRIGLIFLAALLGCTGLAQAQTAKDLVGSWRLVSNTGVLPDGTKTSGSTLKGMAMFDAYGNFIILNSRSDLPKFQSNSRLTGTAEENKAVVVGSLSVFGTFTVENNDLNLKVEGGSWAAWHGTVQKRTILSLTADELRYTVAASTGGSNDNVFKRIK
jgi:hypothetical protein